MVLNIPENGVSIESSAQAAAELPEQAFAIALTPSVIEDMILCVQNGGDIHLALGSIPVRFELPFIGFSGYCSRVRSMFNMSTPGIHGYRAHDHNTHGGKNENTHVNSAHMAASGCLATLITVDLCTPMY
jgi:hypothetical protein